MNKLDYVWRTLVVLLVLGGYISSIIGIGNDHYQNIVDVSVTFNNTAMIESRLVFLDNFIRSYYTLPENLIMNMPSLPAVLDMMNQMSWLTNFLYAVFDKPIY